MLNLGVWYSVEEAWTKLFLTQNGFNSVPGKTVKKNTGWHFAQ